MKKIALTSPAASARRSEPATRDLVVHTADDPAAQKTFDAQLEEHHYLGAQCQGGDYLRQTVYRHGEPVALLAWGACCYALKTRDEYIGWNPTQRAERQKLVVQNRRFLLLHERGEHPNLASQVLAAALRVLPNQFSNTSVTPPCSPKPSPTSKPTTAPATRPAAGSPWASPRDTPDITPAFSPATANPKSAGSSPCAPTHSTSCVPPE